MLAVISMVTINMANEAAFTRPIHSSSGVDFPVVTIPEFEMTGMTFCIFLGSHKSPFFTFSCPKKEGTATLVHGFFTALWKCC